MTLIGSCLSVLQLLLQNCNNIKNKQNPQYAHLPIFTECHTKACFYKGWCLYVIIKWHVTITWYWFNLQITNICSPLVCRPSPQVSLWLPAACLTESGTKMHWFQRCVCHLPVNSIKNIIVRDITADKNYLLGMYRAEQILGRRIKIY